MFQTVEIPVWLLIVAGALAAVAALDRIIGPGIRWYFRRRMERAVGRLNTRLQRKIEPFKLARRKDMIVRLAYDARVMEAVADHATETGVPGAVAFAEAESYAREIVPGFSATLYFGFATRAARFLSRIFFRVRVGKVDAALAQIDPKATVIFVMNHRSNMDYVLITWLVAERSALSYAVGEWARVWPLSVLIRAMGAFFIRRNSRNALYRRVLARYMQIATEQGTTQAMFPEGGLSLTGRVGAAKMGLLSYVVAGFDPAGRDVVFVPVGLSYDRVLEDGLLISAAQKGERRFRPRILRLAWDTLRIAWARGMGRRHLYGTAGAGFGPPLSLRDHLAAGGDVETLGSRLMAAITRVVPVLPVPLVAAVLAEGGVTRADIEVRTAAMIDRLVAVGAVVKLPPQGVAVTVAEGLSPLVTRGIVDDALAAVPDKAAFLAFYAAPVQQALENGDPSATQQT
jgi:glycerol-3-phosphate O-acyltransferase